MKALMIAAAFAVAACAGAAAQTQGGPSAVAPYADARSSASDEEVRVARRAYRAACQQNHNDGYCECMTGGMAQMLVPADLAVATAAFSGQAVSASAVTGARVDAARTDVDRGCARFRD